MNLINSCGIPDGLLRLVKCAEEQGADQISWNLQKSRDGSFSLKFWTCEKRAKNGTKGTHQRKRTERPTRPRAVTPEKVEHKSTTKGVNPSLGTGKLSGTSPQILELPKSAGKQRKSKTPSTRRRNRRRQAAWRLKKLASRENLRAAAKLHATKDCQRSTTWKRPATGSVTPDADVTPPTPEQASSGPVPATSTPRVLENPRRLDITRPEGASFSVIVEESPSEHLLQESSSTSPVTPNTPEYVNWKKGRVTDCIDNRELTRPRVAEAYRTSFVIGTDTVEIPTLGRRRHTGPCDTCGTTGTIWACNGCCEQRYCSVECQRADWLRGHQQYCLEDSEEDSQ